MPDAPAAVSARPRTAVFNHCIDQIFREARTHNGRYVMICPNSEPKVCSKNCPTRVATVSPTRAIPSASSS